MCVIFFWFKSVTDRSAVDSENTLLDYLQDQEGKKLVGLDGEERKKMSNHVESIASIRERNEKVASLSDVISKNLPTLDPIHANGGPDASLVEKQGAFSDVILAALISGH